MPGYVKKSLNKFNHKPPKLPEHAPHDWTAPIYGQQTQQRATQASTAPLLPPDGKQRIQAIVGTFLYYGLGINSTILVTLNLSVVCCCFGCGEDNVLQGFANDLDGAVERRASGGGVAEVEDSGNVTSCLWRCRPTR